MKEAIINSLDLLLQNGDFQKKQLKEYKFADDLESAKQLFTTIILHLDRSIKDLKWLTAYDDVLEWMLGSDKGLVLSGTPGVLKTTIATMLIPALFRMKYNFKVRPIDSDKIEEHFSIINNSPVVIIDDVGDEDEESKFGIRYRPFEKVVKLCEKKSKMLIITTNLSSGEIEHMYGTRILDRLFYLTKAVKINEESMR